MSKHDFWHLTLPFDLWPWPTIPTWPRSRLDYITNIKSLILALTYDLDSWPWLLTLTLIFDFDPDLLPWPWPWTLALKQGNGEVKTWFLAFDLDLWPTTLTYNPSIAKVMVDPHTNNQGQRSKGSAVRVLTDGRTDGLMERCYQVHYLPDLRSINIKVICQMVQPRKSAYRQTDRRTNAIKSFISLLC